MTSFCACQKAIVAATRFKDPLWNATHGPPQACIQCDPVTTSEAFDELYAATRDRLATQLTALVGDLSEAQDLVQEAFVRAWIRWNIVGAYDDPEGWVRRVAYNLGVSRWRRSRRLVLHPVPEETLSATPTPGADSDALGSIEGVLLALQELPPTERRNLVLHHVCGLSVEEVAAEVGSPIGTVKSSLSRGRRHLAIKLSKEQVFE